MRLLLDTHIALWAVTDDSRLSKRARTLIDDGANELVVSVVTIWEIAIKHVLKREEMPVSAARARELFEAATYRILPVHPGHVVAVGDLPPLHADPFDRMLIAQARTEPLHFMTRDSNLPAYGDGIMLV